MAKALRNWEFKVLRINALTGQHIPVSLGREATVALKGRQAAQVLHHFGIAAAITLLARILQQQGLVAHVLQHRRAKLGSVDHVGPEAVAHHLLQLPESLIKRSPELRFGDFGVPHFNQHRITVAHAERLNADKRERHRDQAHDKPQDPAGKAVTN